MKAYKKIMVGIDGSDQSKLALERGVELAKLYRAELLLVTIEDDGRFVPLVTGSVVSSQLDANLIRGVRDKIQTIMNESVAYAKSEGVMAESMIYYGNARTELADRLPKEKQVDLIVMGATGLNRFERMIVGSNSNFVVQNAPCDVILVRE